MFQARVSDLSIRPEHARRSQAGPPKARRFPFALRAQSFEIGSNFMRDSSSVLPHAVLTGAYRHEEREHEE